MSEPLVSVIIPAYNHESYVAQTIDSVIQQTYQNIELIVIDDGSTDRTAHVIKSYSDKCKTRFSNHLNIFNKNQGVIASLNQGISLANGKYSASIASDDLYLACCISQLVNFLESNSEYGLAVGDNLIVDDKGQRCFWDKKQRTTCDQNRAFATTFCDYIIKKDSSLNLCSDDFGSYSKLLTYNHIPGGFVIRKKVLDEIGGYSNESPLEDLGLMLQLSKKTKFKFIDKPLLQYRWHEGNTIKHKKKMKLAYHQTISLEAEYAKSVGLSHMIPFYKNISVFGVPWLTIELSHGFSKISIIGVSIFRKKVMGNCTTYKFFGIPYYRKRLID
jgi:alpha-1,3-rhamnosyltransferase